MSLQAELITKWINIGFIHGVMNTDNTTISGETIDYGPCAFMNTYNPNTVYITLMLTADILMEIKLKLFLELTKFAQTLLQIVDMDPKKSNNLVISSLEKFPEIFNNCWKEEVKKKFGFTKLLKKDSKIIQDFLEILLEQKVDYTTAFRKISTALENDLKKKDFFSLFENQKLIKDWFARWHQE